MYLSNLPTSTALWRMKLRDLLDFKQKQANVSEAHSARQQAEQAKNQGQSIMVFTIITIIFVSTLNG